MPKTFDLSRSLAALEQDSTLIVVIEMSQSSWLVGGMVPGVERQPLKKISAEATGLLALVHRWRGEAERAGRPIGRIAVAYEAGRDGFWLARWLHARGIEAYVIHPNSVAVSREHRRAKTDRIDTALLMRSFLGWLRGEARHCQMVAIPTAEEEDARRPNREREGLVGGADASGEPDEGCPDPVRHPQLQADLAQGAGASGEFAHRRGDAAAARDACRAWPRHGAVAPGARADQGDRDRPPAPARTSSQPERGPARDGPPAGACLGDRHRDRRHAGERGSLARLARSTGGCALCRAHRLAG